MNNKDMADSDVFAPTPGQTRSRDEYHVWRKLCVDSVDLPLVLVFPPECLRWAKAVLESLESKTIAVPNPDICWKPPWQGEVERAISDGVVLDDSYWSEELCLIRGREFLIPRKWENQPFDRGEIDIPLIDWLPAVVGCCFLDVPNPEYLAIYSVTPLGSVRGTIHAPGDLQCPWRWQAQIKIDRRAASSEEAFSFLLAHELTHALNRLGFVAPAIMNWQGFRVNYLGLDADGEYEDDDLPLGHHRLDQNLDSYSDESESSEVDHLEGLFGQRVRAWNRGFNLWAESVRRSG